MGEIILSLNPTGKIDHSSKKKKKTSRSALISVPVAVLSYKVGFSLCT